MYYLFVLADKLGSLFSRNICYELARRLALLRWCFAKKDRQALEYNLSPIVEDKERIKEYTKEVFINFSYYLADFFQYSKINHDFIRKYVKVSGLEKVQLLLSEGKSIIALTGHIGNYELAGAVTSLLGYPVAAVALPHKDKRLNSFFDSRRNMMGIEVIATGRTIKGCLSALKERKILALLGDKNFSGKSLTLKMFSRYADFPRGGAFFSLKSGACIIPAFLVREDKFFYRLSFEEPITCSKNVVPSEEFLTEQYIRVLEKYIKKYPAQWYMFEKYWLPQK